MARVIIAGLAAAGLLSYCGPTPPDYDALDRYQVEACGEVFSAAEIVRLAYDGRSDGKLPAELEVPAGTVAASYREDSNGVRVRRYPCADDEEDARARLSSIGYTDKSLYLQGDHYLVFDATDRYGISGRYSILLCGFVGEVTSRDSGDMHQQGLFGSFGGAVSDDPEAGALAAELASLTFATGMTRLASDGWPRYVDGITLLTSDQEIGPVRHPGHEDEVDGVGVCAVWVEPDTWGGCDAIRVGVAHTMLTDNDGEDFHQAAIQSLLEGYYGFSGWCGGGP